MYDKHPSSIIDPEDIKLIRRFSADAERLGTLHPQQLALMYERRWFKLFVPRMYNGLEMELPGALQLEEALAWADGSFGWTATLCGGANWFVGFLSPEIAPGIFSVREVCLAGSGRPSGIAKLTTMGCEINGSWHYATGAPHATVFTANCKIEKDGVIMRDEAGNEIVRSFWFRKDEVNINRNWRSIGMVATASHGFSVKDLQVPLNRSFVLEPGKAVLSQPVFHFPFLSFAEATLAVNSSGMAIHFLDECQALLEGREKSGRYSEAALSALQKRLQESITTLSALRESFYATIEKAWTIIKSHQPVEQMVLNEISHTSRQLAIMSRRLVDELYPYGGIIAADPSSDINRVWRDLHTASQHSLLNLL